MAKEHCIPSSCNGRVARCRLSGRKTQKRRTTSIRVNKYRLARAFKERRAAFFPRNSKDIIVLLKGKSGLITGAASGMGHAAAVLFASHGARVMCADIDLP